MAKITVATGPLGSGANKTHYFVESVALGKSGKKVVVTTEEGTRFFIPLSLLPDFSSAAVEHISNSSEDE